MLINYLHCQAHFGCYENTGRFHLARPPTRGRRLSCPNQQKKPWREYVTMATYHYHKTAISYQSEVYLSPYLSPPPFLLSSIPHSPSHPLHSPSLPYHTPNLSLLYYISPPSAHPFLIFCPPYIHSPSQTSYTRVSTMYHSLIPSIRPTFSLSQ